jgi:hypothetical protein
VLRIKHRSPVLGGMRDVALIHYPSCTESIKPSLQCSCNLVVINASEGSLCFQIFLTGQKHATYLLTIRVLFTIVVAYKEIPLNLRNICRWVKSDCAYFDIYYVLFSQTFFFIFRISFSFSSSPTIYFFCCSFNV